MKTKQESIFMKLTVENTEVVSSVKNESQAMMKASGKAFEILSGSLYQHKAAAIIRELSCNAYDSHVCAGKADVPFHVILPNVIHPYFEIEDFGVGLDDYETRNVYLTLFESTKTNTNDNIGAFGLGAKTPISYAGTFTIRTRKNGIERLYTCYKGSDGIPLINLLSEAETTESSGVKVTVPVKASDINTFEYDAQFILSFFDPKPIIKKTGFKFCAEHVCEELKKKNIVMKKVQSYSALYSSRCYVVMGPVCYGVSNSDIINAVENYAFETKKSYSLVKKYLQEINYSNVFFKFDIGDLEVAASRESLSLTDRTKYRLGEKIYTEISESITRDQTIIDTMPTMLEAYKYLVKNVSESPMFIGMFKYNGVAFDQLYNSYLLDSHRFLIFYQNQYNTKTEKYDRITLSNLTGIAKKNLVIVYSKDEKTSGFHKFCRGLLSNKNDRIAFIQGASQASLERYFERFGIEIQQYIDFTAYKEELAEEKKQERLANRKAIATIGNRDYVKLEPQVIKTRYMRFTDQASGGYDSTQFDLSKHDDVVWLNDDEYESFVAGCSIRLENESYFYPSVLVRVIHHLEDVDNLYIVKRNRFTQKKLDANGIKSLHEFLSDNAINIIHSYINERDSYKFINDSSDYADYHTINAFMKFAFEIPECKEILFDVIEKNSTFLRSMLSSIDDVSMDDFFFNNTYKDVKFTDEFLDHLLNETNGVFTKIDIEKIYSKEINGSFAKPFIDAMNDRFPLFSSINGFDLDECEEAKRYIRLILQDEKK